MNPGKLVFNKMPTANGSRMRRAGTRDEGEGFKV